MNCINTQLTGGDGSEMDSFPSMFVANLQSVDMCPTTQSVAVLFPNPGKYVTTKKASPRGSGAATDATFPMATPTGSGCSGDGGAASGGSGSGYGSSAAAASSTAAPMSSAYGAASAAQSVAVSQATGASGGSSLVTITTMATVTGAASSAAASSAVASSAAGTAPSYSSASSSGSSSSSDSSDCSNDGAVVCSSDGTQFGLCNAGSAVMMAVSAGTECKDGKVTKRDAPARMRHIRRHIAGKRSF